jgi:hypothetical protein
MKGASPDVAFRDTSSVNGAAPATVTVVEFLAVWPAESVTVTLSVNVPGVVKVCVTVEPVPVEPSPKVQDTVE